MNGRPFIRNLIYHLSTSERSELGQFLAFWQILINNNVWSQLRQIIGGAKGYSPPPPPPLKKNIGGGGVQPVPMHMGYGVTMIQSFLNLGEFW